eukprot:CAMPEP_0184496644 /NCGR_PEP_ID=MMETSP0113_2-20130426/34504_1 /TAXON_ID=91329 /ORGANISM="Norrisiella sphaerica, Strain BC52" /LENGTH=611 /DNA_ID=CAMNT_0026883369 /DNA_START=117 /DNA_END=1952 /DNA_ORIENTATION=+
MLLRDLLKELEKPTPKDVDPEDEAFANQGARVVDMGDDLYKDINDMKTPSVLRSKAAGIPALGSSYDGKVVSRASLQKGEEREDDEGDDDDEGEDDEGDGGGDDDDDDGEDDDEADAKAYEELARKARGKSVRFSHGPDEEREFDLDEEEDDLSEGAEGEENAGDDNGDDFPVLPSRGRVGAAAVGRGSVVDDKLVQTLEAELERVTRDEKAFSLEQTKDRYSKARAVRAQHRLWENSLKTRIRLQAPLTLANQLPYPDVFPNFRKAEPKVEEAVVSAAETTLGLLRSLIGLQDKLLERSASFRARTGKLPPTSTTTKSSSSSSGPSGPNSTRKRKLKAISAEMNALWDYASGDFADQAEDAASVLERWNTKTKLASGHGTKIGRKFKALDRSVGEQIDDLLGDMPKLTKRMHLRRLEGRPLGSAEPRKDMELGESEELVEGRALVYDPEVFDDTDFYQTLLREVIDGASLGAQGSLGGLRQRSAKKARKLKDRRASKGRKLRYVNIPELTNFTAPTEELEEDYPRDSLFLSLFGQQPGQTAPLKVRPVTSRMDVSTNDLDGGAGDEIENEDLSISDMVKDLKRREKSEQLHKKKHQEELEEDEELDIPIL